MTHIKKLEDEIVRNGMPFIKMTGKMEKLQHEIKLLATDNEKLARENAKLAEELKVTRGCCWNPNASECEFCKKTKKENELLTKVAEAAIPALADLKDNDRRVCFENGISLTNTEPPESITDLDQALSAWRKWKEKM